MSSLRVGTHTTGRPTRRARNGSSTSSAWGRDFAPKLPPTSWATTRTAAGSRP